MSLQEEIIQQQVPSQLLILRRSPLVDFLKDIQNILLENILLGISGGQDSVLVNDTELATEMQKQEMPINLLLFVSPYGVQADEADAQKHWPYPAGC